jgi:hypothetical protein
MPPEKMIRVIAGTFILISVALTIWVSPWWLIWTTLIGVNLVQSAFTGWCPAEIFLKKFGIQGGCCSTPEKK